MTNPVPTRESKAVDIAAVRRTRTRHDELAPRDRVHEQLAELREFIRLLNKTEQGQMDLAQRFRLLGECRPLPEESEIVFYGRLREWLDRDLGRYQSGTGNAAKG